MRITAVSGLVNILSAVLAFGVTYALGKPVLSMFERLGFIRSVQGERVNSRRAHADGSIAPLGGGVMMMAGVCAASAVCLPVFSAVMAKRSIAGIGRLSTLSVTYILAGIIMALLLGAVGTLEDRGCASGKMPNGLPVGWRMTMTALVSLAYCAGIWIGGDKGTGRTLIPFVGEVNIGFWLYAAVFLMIPCVTEGTRLYAKTEGVCPSVCMFSAVALLLISALRELYDFGIIAAAVAGCCIGLLMWSSFPARLYTGYSGTMFAGGIICALACGLRIHLLIVPICALSLADGVIALVCRLTDGKCCETLYEYLRQRKMSRPDISAVYGCGALLLGVVCVLAVWLT